MIYFNPKPFTVTTYMHLYFIHWIGVLYNSTEKVAAYAKIDWLGSLVAGFNKFHSFRISQIVKILLWNTNKTNKMIVDVFKATIWKENTKTEKTNIPNIWTFIFKKRQTHGKEKITDYSWLSLSRTLITQIIVEVKRYYCIKSSVARY